MFDAVFGITVVPPQEEPFCHVVCGLLWLLQLFWVLLQFAYAIPVF